MDQQKIFDSMKRIARRAGLEVITKALTLWYCLLDKDTPTRIKALIIGDLLYLISPIDAIPDMIPGIGFSDDLGVLTLAFGVLAAHIKPEHHDRAKAKAVEWLG